ncbi:putative ABC transport system permease protein [Clostridium sp. USBA 49]|uniref:ABC transporter permease n=1 Tax=Clostridium sp. USBA 49 TaxID=1881060 RepID=UPI0009990CA6|nr:ABC transporter permease [Clostridium sp. USBA 49]SKA85117.1 putative ABC transport system permease protein [Clostridium sp. USBA 49]
MSIINLIRTSIYSLKSHKLRVFLTMIGIIIGISSVVTILSIGDGLKAEVNKSVEDTSANKINVYFESENMGADLTLIEPFNKTDAYYLKKVAGVEKVEASQGFAGISFTSGQINFFDKNVTVMLDSYDGKKLNIKYGRSFKENENSSKLIVLNFEAAKSLFDSPEKAIDRAVSINGTNYEVIGVLGEVGAFSLTGTSSYISKTAKEEMNSDTNISSLDIYIKTGEDKSKVFEDIKKELIQQHPNLKGEYKLQDPQAITKAFEKIIGGLTAFIALVTGISLFVGGIGVMNIMYVSVSERKREIGIRRAIGAKPKSILLQFLFEAILVTGTGGLIGIICGFLFGKIVGIFLPFPPVLTVGSFLGSTLTSVLVGIIFGIIPAVNASKMDPIKAIYR